MFTQRVRDEDRKRKTRAHDEQHSYYYSFILSLTLHFISRLPYRFSIHFVSIIFRIKSRNGTRRRLNRFLLTRVILRFGYYLMQIIFKQESYNVRFRTETIEILVNLLSAKPLNVIK